MKPPIVLAVFERSIGERSLADLRIGGITLLVRALRSASRAEPERVIIYASDHDRVERTVLGDAAWPGARKLHGAQLQVVCEVRPMPAGVTSLAALFEAEHPRLPTHVLAAELDGLYSPGLFVESASDARISAIADVDGRFIGVYDVRGRPPGGYAGALAAARAEPERMIAKATYHAVTSVSDIALAFATLRRSLRKPLARSADGLTAYFINRPISLVFSKLLVDTAITPNHVTAVALAMGLAGSWFAAKGSWTALVLGGVLLQASSIFDGVDGELARMRLTMSKAGEWFDTVCDDIINLSFMLALGFACAVRTGDVSYVTFGWAGAGIGAALALSMYRDEIAAGVASHNHFEWKVNAGPLQPIVEAFGYVAKRDTYTLLLVVLLALDLPRVAFWIMFAGTAIIAVAAVAQKLRAAFAAKA